MAILPLSVFAVKYTFNPEALGNISDLTTPSSTQKYVIGQVINVVDTETYAIKKYMYVQADDYYDANRVVQIQFSSTAASEIIISTGTSQSIDYSAAVTPVAFTKSYYGFVQIAGDCTVVPSTNTTLGNYARILKTSTLGGDSGGVTISSTTFGIWKATSYGGGTATKLYLLGDRRAYAW